MKNEKLASIHAFDIGDNVSYTAVGICRITGIEKKCFDGENEYDYYILSPVNSNTSKYYLPVDKCEGKLRKLLSKEQIIDIIDNALKSDDIDWESNCRERKAKFNSILSGDDSEQLFQMLKTIHFQQEKNKLSGKKLVNSDEAVMKAAENIVFQEFAVVLGIEYDEVKNFISQRAEKII